MSRQSSYTGKAPGPFPFSSQAIKANGMVYTSGQLGVDPKTSKLVPGGIKAETRQCLVLLRDILEAAGSSLNDLVKVNIFITNVDHFAAMNEVYAEVFDEKITVKPVRTCVVVYALPANGLVEMECSALISTPKL